MERFDVRNHLFYDGYDLENELLENPEFIKNIMEQINQKVFDNRGLISILPYFDGKIKKDGGVSGIIIGDNFHFTCHTFSFKNTVFVDYFGDEAKKEIIQDILFNVFDTKNYDMGSKNIKGNFGKHIIMSPKPLNLNESIKMIETILKEIDMTPITKMIINKKDDFNFDILQPIAESHISIHRIDEQMVVDAFSCKYFDVNKLLELFKISSDYIEVNRGLKYKE